MAGAPITWVYVRDEGLRDVRPTMDESEFTAQTNTMPCDNELHSGTRELADPALRFAGRAAVFDALRLARGATSIERGQAERVARGGPLVLRMLVSRRVGCLGLARGSFLTGKRALVFEGEVTPVHERDDSLLRVHAPRSGRRVRPMREPGFPAGDAFLESGSRISLGGVAVFEIRQALFFEA
jgi:hypothetical protein